MVLSKNYWFYDIFKQIFLLFSKLSKATTLKPFPSFDDMNFEELGFNMFENSSNKNEFEVFFL